MKRIPATGIVGVVALREAASAEYVQVMGLVRAALQARYDAAKPASGGYSSWFDIEAMYADRAIVCKDGRYWQFGYSIDDKNMVQLQEPVEVIERFDPVKLRESVDAGHVLLAEAAQDGTEWDAVILKAGKSDNGNYYTDALLRESVAKFEGVKVYAKSNEDHIKGRKHPDVHQLAGWISGVKFVEGKTADTGYLMGRLNLTGMSALRETIVGAWQKGKKDLVGLSIDAIGTSIAAKAQQLREGIKRIAHSFVKVNSVDLIIDPSAGGALVRLVEAANPEEQDPMKDLMLAAIKAKFPNLDVTAFTEAQILEKYVESQRTDSASGTPMTREEFAEYQRLVEARTGAVAQIQATTLPKPAKDALIARFGSRLERFTEADVKNEIEAERGRVIALIEATGGDAGKVRLASAGDIQVGDRSTQIAHMLDAFFNPGGKDAQGKLYPAVHSFKECYVEITGDRKVTGRMENCDRSRLAESVGAAFRESVDTTGFSNVLGVSLTRRMVADYNNASEFDGWRQIVGTPVPLNDFRTQTRVRFGGYGDLATVNQGAAYPALASPTDEAPTYTPAKRGGTEDVTLEAIKNDDVGAIRRIPIRMSRAAKRTLGKFVFDFLRTNPTIYDSVAFFHATHNNLGSTAFSAAEYGVVRIAMAKQAELNSADRLGIYPNIIVYPLDLQETVWNAFQRNTNLDKTFVQSLAPVMVPVWYWTDTNDWVAMANPADIPTIEVGFLDGQEEPMMFVQDMPNVGSMFSNDKLTYKIRHIYGGAVCDFRGAYKEVV